MTKHNIVFAMVLATGCMILTPTVVADIPAAAVVINEFMASNQSTTLDPDSLQYADWIELYNGASVAVDLGGAYLSDDFANPQKWQIPKDVILPATGYLLLWADEYDITAKGLHTNFKLGAAGEELGLFTSEGAVIDTIRFSRQITDISYGRAQNANNRWLYFESPTPAKANGIDGLTSSRQAVELLFSLPSGFVSQGQTISLTTPTEGTIHFTTDGENPGRSAPIFKSPIALTRTTVVKARCYQDGLLPGPIVTRTYFVDEQSTLPVFSLSTAPGNLYDESYGIYVDEDIAERKNWRRPALLEFFEPDGHQGFSQEVDIRLFGRTAIFLPQKSISLFPSTTIDYPLLPNSGVKYLNSFLLRSSSDDWHRTMFRDGFIQTLVQQNLDIDTQAYRPAVLFINGEYFGIHNIREKYNGDYLASHHGVDADNNDLLYIDERQPDPITVLEGDRDHYEALMDFVAHNDLAIPTNYELVANQVDLANFMDYVIIEAICGNVSWAHNIRIWRPKTEDGKWQWLVFDLDRGFRDRTFNALSDMAERMPLFHALLANPGFAEQFLQRITEYLNTIFVPEQMTALLDSLQQGISAEMPRHIERWKGICANNVCGIPSMVDWQNNVTDMRNIVQERPAIIRQQIADLFDVNGAIRLNVHVEPPGYGKVQLGASTIVDDHYSGEFFSNQLLNLDASANPGFSFLGWYETTSSLNTLLQRGSSWKYFDQATVPDASWNTLNFDDAAWKTGRAQFGYGDNDETTPISFGNDDNNKYMTSYYRTLLTVNDPSSIDRLTFRLLRDDGAVVYVNGQELFRSNMPAGVISFDTPASSSVGGDDEDSFFEFIVPGSTLSKGANCLAVEVHQYEPSSSDVSFDLEIVSEQGSQERTLISRDQQLRFQATRNQSLTAEFDIDRQHLFPQVPAGELTLTSAGSPYLLLEDVLIPAGSAVTIQPGAEIHVAEGKNILIHGSLRAIGSLQQPIVFLGINHHSWGALCFEDAAQPSALSHVVVRDATSGADAVHFKAAVSTRNSELFLDHVAFQNVIQPFYGYGGSITLLDCQLDGTNAGDDILNIQFASARIEKCHLFGNGELDLDSVDDGIIRNNLIEIISSNSNRDGIDIGASRDVVIENNRIFNCPDKGISVGEESVNTLIRGNLIHQAAMGIAVKDHSTAIIDHNTIYSADVGVSVYEKIAGEDGGSAVVSNTIFSGRYTQEYAADVKSSVQFSYCLSEKSLLEGIGNIQGDARFRSILDQNFYLHADSPCINAGDPTSPPDADGT
ncbi:MAG: hypothetical protein EHM72_13550, partial [Calditrichaeota bacterium]